MVWGPAAAAARGDGMKLGSCPSLLHAPLRVQDGIGISQNLRSRGHIKPTFIFLYFYNLALGAFNEGGIKSRPMRLKSNL